jgi:hypothetical protein
MIVTASPLTYVQFKVLYEKFNKNDSTLVYTTDKETDTRVLQIAVVFEKLSNIRLDAGSPIEAAIDVKKSILLTDFPNAIQVNSISVGA